MKLRVYIVSKVKHTADTRTKDSVLIDVFIREEEAQAVHVELMNADPDAMHSIHYKDLELTEAAVVLLRAAS